MISQEELKKKLHYCPDTGNFTRVKTGELAGGINQGYLRIGIGGKKYSAHRLAFLYMTGDAPLYIDHINRDRCDNRWCNLRPASKTLNGYNMSLRKDNKTGIKGVTRFRGKWKAGLTVNKKYLYLGLFEDLELAELVINEARIKYHGEFATTGV